MVALVKPYALSFSASPISAGVANQRLLISLLIIPLSNDFLIGVDRQMLCAEGLSRHPGAGTCMINFNL